ncbi:hypothetical protein ZTR_09658 [Talaromyces verruculosus]|nr:hypothetical protein ZTR_09658 [Talaromyces verruculosus]
MYKRALLIASPYGGLKGPVNDVEVVAGLLTRHGFEVMRCCKEGASREGILGAWQQLISQIQQDDVVFIYYSGHGGLVEPSQAGNNRRYQFIVPTDYGEDGFRGILDVELSFLLQKTTAKTTNVTTFFDCCYAGRMARNSFYGKNAIPKRLPKTDYHIVTAHIERLQQEGILDLSQLIDVEGNDHAVRIVAAADSETAWEIMDDQDVSTGVATKALVSVMDEALSTGVSWKYAVMRMSEMVNAQCPEQHPHAEGPYDRVIFSQDQKDFAALVVQEENGEVVLQGGRASLVREGNRYTIMPLHSHEIIDSELITTATVRQVTGFRSILQLHDDVHLPKEGALAFLSHEALYQWPIALAEDLHSHTEIFETSRFIRPSDGKERTEGIAHIYKEGKTICLDSGVGEKRLRIASVGFDDSDSMTDALTQVRNQTDVLARGCHLLALKAKSDELLPHDLRVTFEVNKEDQGLPLDGSGVVQVGDRAIITLHNHGDSEVYVSVFDINAVGRISHLSRSSPWGRRIRPQEKYELGVNDLSKQRRGLEMSWPKGFPADVNQPIPESFICMITSEPVDLRDLSRERRGERRSDPSQLEKLAYQLTYGQGRDCAGEREDRSIQWDAVRVPFLLQKDVGQVPDSF